MRVKGKDKAFKVLNHIFEQGYQVAKADNGYNPDVLAINSEENRAIILEHSSTGDRKVNIGEMFQADKWLRDKEYKGELIFVLDGQSENSPTCNGQFKRLSPLFEEYLKGGTFGLKKVVIISRESHEGCIDTTEILKINTGNVIK